jgi:hypothetical protein
MLVCMKSKNHVLPALPAAVSALTPIELAQKIPVADAAARNGVHVDTFKKNYPHLLKRIGKRRLAVTLYDAIMLPPPDTS